MSATSHPTWYGAVRFRSRLEARWAAFFDLQGWRWEYEPLDLLGWTPDFRVWLPCQHSECNAHHVLLCEVKPHDRIEAFHGHPCLKYAYGGWSDDDTIPADSSAALGTHPDVSWFEISHGHGGGVYRISDWADGHERRWREAGNRVQWRPPGV